MKVNTKYFIEKSTIKHGDRYDYSNAIVVSSRSKVTITCSLHGEFIQSAYKHMEGHGCPTCKKRKTAAEFVEQANNIHNYHYNYNNVKYETNRMPVTITCKLHGNFQQTPTNHLKGHGSGLGGAWPKHSFGGEKECFGIDQLSVVLSAITSEIPYIL